MQINTSTLRAISKGFNRRFQDGYEQAVPMLQGRIATEVPSTTRSNVYGWMAKSLRLREWIGERVLQNVGTRDYEIANRDFEATVAVDRNDIEDDSIGVYSPLMQDFGNVAATWGDDLILELLEAGITSECWDGQFFFDSDHPISPDLATLGTYSNRFVGALTEGNLWDVRRRMMQTTGENGKRLRVVPNLLVVPAALEKTAREILERSVSNNNTNITQGLVQYLVVPDLLDDTAWYLMDVTRPIRPFVLQNRKNPEFVAMDNPEDPNVFFRNEFIYGVDLRGNAGYALPFLAARCAPVDASGTAL